MSNKDVRSNGSEEEKQTCSVRMSPSAKSINQVKTHTEFILNEVSKYGNTDQEIEARSLDTAVSFEDWGSVVRLARNIAEMTHVDRIESAAKGIVDELTLEKNV